ncbi:MAG TPA: hypothetical protein VGN60_13505 [Devosia sp.]|jgi:S-adenosylmethionine synthetase|nr:hypothetical protein [Devosia sp.]
MFGYGVREMWELLPAPTPYDHKILDALTQAPKEGTGPAEVLNTDARLQVTIRCEDGKPVAVTQIALDPASRRHVDLGGRAEIVEPLLAKSLPKGGSATIRCGT